MSVRIVFSLFAPFMFVFLFLGFAGRCCTGRGLICALKTDLRVWASPKNIMTDSSFLGIFR